MFIIAFGDTAGKRQFDMKYRNSNLAKKTWELTTDFTVAIRRFFRYYKGMTIMDLLIISGLPIGLGAGIVFLLFTILIFVIFLAGKKICSRDLNKTYTQTKAAAPVSVMVPVSGSKDTDAVTAAIAAAVNEYRKLFKTA